MAKLLGGTTILGKISSSGFIYAGTNNSANWNSAYKLFSALNLSSIKLPLLNQYIFTAVGANTAINGQNLLNAYQAATTLTPNGSALSTTNRAVIFIPPGTYGTVIGLTLNVPYIDIFGIGGNSNDVIIDKLNQTANDVRVSNITILTDGCNLASNLSLTVWTNCTVSNSTPNIGGFGIGNNKSLSGTFNNCVGINTGGNGGGFVGYFGTASGTFNDCIGINSADFGGGFGGYYGQVGGVFNNCIGRNTGFNGGGFTGYGMYSRTNGTFINCTGTNSGDNGGGFNGSYSTDSAYGAIGGTFINCTGRNTGVNGGGFVGVGGSLYGVYNNCIGINTGTNGTGFFGLNATATSISKFYNCSSTTDTAPISGFNAALVRNHIDANGEVWNYN